MMDPRTRRTARSGLTSPRVVRGEGVVIGLVLLLLLLPVDLVGQTTVTPTLEPRSDHPEAVKAIGQLRSPYCPGLMLEVCSAPASGALRDSIQMLARGGMTSDQLVEWMIGNHGEIYRAVPSTQGRGLWAWLGPPIGLALGLVGLLMLFYRMRQRGPRVRPAHAQRVLSDAESARVRAAIREMETLEEPIL